MKWSPVKERVSSLLGRRWTSTEIAKATGYSTANIDAHLRCIGIDGCTATHGWAAQKAIADYCHSSIAVLFGDHAWFRLAGNALVARRARAILQPDQPSPPAGAVAQPGEAKPVQEEVLQAVPEAAQH